jgi:2-oxo-4-hydroxy-4-carboxy-5-ureidoimidazoline decarboxylase
MAAAYLCGAAGKISNGFHSDKHQESRYHCGLAAALGSASLLAVALLLKTSPLLTLVMLALAIVGTMSAIPVTQTAFLCGHPELAGKEAEAGTMITESVDEQASAGLDALSRHEVGELRQLNQRYLDSHGFSFIIAVRRHSKSEIFDQLRSRIERNSDAELDEALAQIGAITRLRIQAKLSA